MNRARFSPYWALSLSALLAGSSVAAGRLTVTRMPVYLSQAACLAAALVVLIPAAAGGGRGMAFLKVGKRDLALLALQAFLGMFAFRVLLLSALKFASAAQVGIVTGLTPACTALLSAVLLREALSRRLLAGLLLSLSGVLAVQASAWSGSASAVGDGIRHSLPGFLLALLAVFGESMLTILRRASGSRVPPLTGTVYVVLFAFPMFLPGALHEAISFDWASLKQTDIGLVLYYGLFVTAAAYLLWFSGVSRTSAGTAAVFSGFIPVSAVLLSCAVLRDPFTPLHAGGTALAFAGMLLVSAPSLNFLPPKPQKSVDDA